MWSPREKQLQVRYREPHDGGSVTHDIRSAEHLVGDVVVEQVATIHPESSEGYLSSASQQLQGETFLNVESTVVGAEDVALLPNLAAVLEIAVGPHFQLLHMPNRTVSEPRELGQLLLLD